MKVKAFRFYMFCKLGALPVFAALMFLGVPLPRSIAQQGNRQLQQGPATTNSQRRLALVIGNGAYQNANRLANPVNDATDMAAALRELGFVLVGGHAHVNQSADQMKRLIIDFGDLLSGGGVGLFYYAGHGVQSQGHNYLVPVEANLLKEKTLEFDAVDVNRVLAQMDEAGNGFNIVILDACRNNPFSRSWRDASQGLAQVNAPEGTLIAYATSPGRVASDGTGRNGTYTSELLKQMRTSGLKIEEMFKAVRADVKTVTNNQQTPWESSSLVGEFCFTGGCSKNASPTNASNETTTLPVSRVDPAAIELSYWESIKNSSDPNDFKAYVDKYPDGQFSSLAKNKISSLSTAAKPESKSSTSGDATEIAFWDTIKDSKNAGDYQAYLKKYPKGVFAELAASRAAALEAEAKEKERAKEAAEAERQVKFFTGQFGIHTDETFRKGYNFGRGRLAVSPNSVLFILDNPSKGPGQAKVNLNLDGHEGNGWKLRCSENLKLDGYTIQEIEVQGSTHKWRFWAQSRSESASAFEAIRAACKGQ